MIFICESGSTKCDWVLIDPQGREIGRWNTMGFNPYFHNADLIQRVMSQEKDIIAIASEIKQIWFYGAGCSTAIYKGIVHDGLSRIFSNAEIHVGHDLDASAFALYEGRPEVACILGTGSNSCYFDGKTVSEVVPALGYILGDEGSASFIGKRIVADYLYKRLPSDLHKAFEDIYHTSKDEIIHRVYNEPHANVYLAGFSRFAGQFSEHAYIQQIVGEGFEKFIDVHVLCYAEAKNADINFVGSVAKQFEPLLKEKIAQKGLTYGRTQAKPANLLVKYHIEHLKVLESLKTV